MFGEEVVSKADTVLVVTQKQKYRSLSNRDQVNGLREGVDRMFREMEEAGCPAPEYRHNEFMVYATIRQHRNATRQETGQVAGQETGQVKETVQRLVLVLGEQTLTRKQIMDLLSLKGRDNFRVNYMEPSMKDGFVAKLYPDSDNRPDQAYYLTEKGLHLLSELKPGE